MQTKLHEAADIIVDARTQSANEMEAIEKFCKDQKFPFSIVFYNEAQFLAKFKWNERFVFTN